MIMNNEIVMKNNEMNERIMIIWNNGSKWKNNSNEIIIIMAKWNNNMKVIIMKMMK